jgi:hypothetical protein
VNEWLDFAGRVVLLLVTSALLTLGIRALLKVDYGTVGGWVAAVLSVWFILAVCAVVGERLKTGHW